MSSNAIEVQAACDNAHKLAQKNHEPYVVYRDYDEGTEKLKVVSLKTWEIWVDEDLVDDIDLHSVYEG